VFNNNREVKIINGVTYLPIYYSMFLRNVADVFDDKYIIKPLRLSDIQ